MLAAYENDPRPRVDVAVAGRSNALSGTLCGTVKAAVVSMDAAHRERLLHDDADLRPR